LVRVKADCANGKAERITVQNLPSFAGELDVELEVEGLGTIKIDTAYGGDSFVVVDAQALGFDIKEEEAGDIARLGVKITNAANEQIGFHHPENPDWKHISFCLFAGPLEKVDGGYTARSAVAIQPGKVDRSPTGTAVSARMALLHKRGLMKVGETFVATSIIGSQFSGKIVSEHALADRTAIIPQISGRGWVTGIHQHMLDPLDPWPGGYKLPDTWGA
jgi:proline racemase